MPDCPRCGERIRIAHDGDEGWQCGKCGALYDADDIEIEDPPEWADQPYAGDE